MDDQQLLRYSRQIILPNFGYEQQLKLQQSTVLLIGLGGLGSPIAMYLASSGIGHLMINDFDTIDLSNIQRQILYQQSHIGLSKANTALKQLQAINSDINITEIDRKLNQTELTDYAQQADVIVDASDNFATRYLINQVAVATKTALVSGAAIRFEGQVVIFSNQSQDSGCYHCLYGNVSEQDTTCADNGVMAPVVGMIGSLQALETIKYLTIGSSLESRLFILDATTMESRIIKLKADPKCKICQAI